MVKLTKYNNLWNARSPSRIDRVYVPKNWTELVQQVQVRLPVVQSDHQTITHLSRIASTGGIDVLD